MTESKIVIGPIPDHLRKYAWYAEHQAYLRDQGRPHHDPGDAIPRRADLRRADLRRANLTDANLRRAVLTAADLTRANLTGADLTDANLTLADLTAANLALADLTDADLTLAVLTRADLRRANLTGAELTGAVLTAADLADAVGLPAAPVVPRIDAAILSAIEAGGTLNMAEWHTCKTTHCRAGWAVTLAGEAGRELERRTSPYLAGRLIYEASRPGVPCPDLFASDQDAMEDLRRCAAFNTGEPK